MADVDYTKKVATIVKATPRLVNDLLAMNTQNRNVKKSHLAWLTEAVKSGSFLLTTQAIGISSKGVLLDGQHRLMAIRAAGYPPVELLIVTGLEEKARVYIDQGAKRSSADMLKIVLNKSVSSRMAAMVNTFLRMGTTKDGFTMVRGKANLDDVVETMDKHFDRICDIMEAAGGKPRAGVLAAYLDYSLRHDHRRALMFIQSVNDGENLTKDMPAYRLRQFIMGESRKTSYGHLGQTEDYRHTVWACKAHALDQKVTAMRPDTSWVGIKMLASNYPQNIHVASDGKTIKRAVV